MSLSNTTGAGATSTTDSPAKSRPLDQPYSIKRHGLTLDNCDSEPVRTPGCVQSHGALLVLRRADLKILQASDNTQFILGWDPELFLGQAIGTVIGADAETRLQAMLLAQATDGNPLYLVTLPSGGGGPDLVSRQAALDVTVHTMDGAVILEFESTGRTQAGAQDHDYYALVKKTVTRLQSTDSLQQFCDFAAQEIREITGMDRVMVYKFHDDGHGEVFAESKRSELAPWLGMHYPAEDVPKPARDVFCKTWIRPIPNMSDKLAEMRPLVNPDTGKPVDMIHCYLRGVSLMCSEYYQNIGVGATLTLSIRRNDRLWGLVSCTHAEPRFLGYQVRAACEFLAQVVSLQLAAAEDKEHVAYRSRLEGIHRQLVAAAATEGDLLALIKGKPSLLDGMDAGGAALYCAGGWHCLGETPEAAQLEALGKWLNQVKLPALAGSLYATDCLVRDYPAAAAFARQASGVLAVPLPAGGFDNLMLWFKPETMQTVNWAGDPHNKPTVTGPNGPRLTPRRSFESFVESVRERSLPWKNMELDAVANLKLLLAQVLLGRARQQGKLDAELASSNEQLDAFTYVASHDLKEPLRGIHRYAHQLLEDATLVDDRDRGKLDRMMQMTLRMDSLLESLVYFTRISKDDLLLDSVNLNEVVAEAAELVSSGRFDTRLKIDVARLLPVIQANRAWCREIFVNLLSNALKYTRALPARIEIGALYADEKQKRPACPEGSENDTIYYVADHGIGIAPQFFNQIFKLFKRLHGQEEYGGGAGTGLTVVRKLVERHHGKVWLSSVPGKGTTFYFTLPGERNTE